MTELPTSGARSRRDTIHEQAQEMVSHLRTEVLSVPGRRALVSKALGHVPGHPRTFSAYREITEFFPEKPKYSEERAFLAIAAMLCAQPAKNRAQEGSSETQALGDAERDSDDSEAGQGTDPGSLGESCAVAVNRRMIAEKTVESRLHQMCRSDSTGLHRQLPRLIHHLRGIGITIDWATLTGEIASWDFARERIAARWLRDFYREISTKTASVDTKTDDVQE